MPPAPRRSRSHNNMTNTAVPNRTPRSNNNHSSWSDVDDKKLWTARAQGQNWDDIQTAFFPEKTSNACRKRHERLRQLKDQQELLPNGARFDNLADAYADCREEMWTLLAKKLDPEAKSSSWEVLERLVFENGLKTLMTTNRSRRRRRNVSPSDSIHSYVSISSNSPSPSVSGSETIRSEPPVARQVHYASPPLAYATPTQAHAQSHCHSLSHSHSYPYPPQHQRLQPVQHHLPPPSTSHGPLPAGSPTTSYPYRRPPANSNHIQDNRSTGMSVYAMLSPNPPQNGHAFGR